MNTNFELKRLSAGRYEVVGTTIIIERDGQYWYATDKTTGQSIIDCESTKRDITASAMSVYRNYIK